MARTLLIDETRSPILLVEDNPDDAGLALYALAGVDLDGSVRVVRDGIAALDLLLGPEGADVREPLRLILLDINLPRARGIEVLGRLKSSPETRLIPVVMLTSSGEPRDLQACYDLGANGFIVKPVDFTAYAEAVVQAARYWLTVNTSVAESGAIRHPLNFEGAPRPLRAKAAPTGTADRSTDPARSEAPGCRPDPPTAHR